jgi:competence protein ComEC
VTAVPVREPPDLRLVLPALGAWAGAAVAVGTSARTAGVAAVAVVALAVAAGVVALRSSSPELRAAVAVLVCVAGGCGAAAVRTSARERGPLPALAGSRARVTATIVLTSDPMRLAGRVVGARRVDGTVYVRARIEHVRSGGRAWRLRHPVLVFGSGEGWRDRLPGDRLAVRATVSPGGSRDVAAVLSVRAPPDVVRRTGPVGRLAGRLRAGLHEAAAGLPAKTAGLLPGLVDGDTSRLDPRLRTDFERTGMTHLVAVSGSNVAVVLAAALLLARRLGLGPRSAAGLAGLLLLSFVVLARPSPSVLRAAGMGAIGLVAAVTGRERRALPALAGTVLGLVLFDPALARSPGFALSTCATAGLLVLAPGWRAALATRLPGWLADALAIPLAAQAACTPLVAALSGEVSLVAVPANVVAMPAVGLATIGGVVAALCAPVALPVARVAAWLAGVPAGWLVWVAEHFADVPFGALPWLGGAAGAVAAVAAVLAGAVALRRPQVRRLTGVAVASGFAVALTARVVAPGWPPPGWQLVACDVGQGDALVVRDGAAVIVVDTGPDPEAVDGCLRDLGVRRIAAVVLTHLHADHVEGLPGVLRGRAVGVVQLGPLDEPADEAERVGRWLREARLSAQRAVLGESRAVGRIRYTVLGPAEAFHGTDSDPNNSSLVLTVTLPGLSVLLTGDVEVPAQQAVLARAPDLRVDVLKVPHHGSRKQVAAFSAATGASAAITSVGRDNPYGQPAEETMRQIAADGIRGYRTDRDGDIAVTRRGRVLEVVGRRGRGSPPDRPPPAAWTVTPAFGPDGRLLLCPVRDPSVRRPAAVLRPAAAGRRSGPRAGAGRARPPPATRAPDGTRTRAMLAHALDPGAAAHARSGRRGAAGLPRRRQVCRRGARCRSAGRCAGVRRSLAGRGGADGPGVSVAVRRPPVGRRTRCPGIVRGRPHRLRRLRHRAT